MRLRHLRLVETPAMTKDEHDQQRTWVEMSERLSRFSRERRDEGTAQRNLYSTRERARAGNVIPLGSKRPPEPPRPAA